MKIYFADTNIFLRFLLQDNLQQYNQAKNYFILAKAYKIKILVLSEIVLEIDYVLKKVYSLSRVEISQKIIDLVSCAYFDVKDRDLWLNSLELYSITNFDLVDIFIFEKASHEGAEVLSFDQDFRKLKKFKR